MMGVNHPDSNVLLNIKNRFCLECEYFFTDEGCRCKILVYYIKILNLKTSHSTNIGWIEFFSRSYEVHKNFCRIRENWVILLTI